MCKKLGNHGYSLMESLLAITLVIIFIAATASIFTQKKSPAKVTSHGRFECFKNTLGELNQRIFDEDGNLSSEGKNIGECEFVVPENAEMFSVEVIGGGGGGAAATNNGLLSDGLEVLEDTVQTSCNKQISNRFTPYINDKDFNKYVLGGSYIVEVSGGTTERNPYRPFSCIYNAYFKAGDAITCSKTAGGENGGGGTTGASGEFKVTNRDYKEVNYSITPTSEICPDYNGDRENRLLNKTSANNLMGSSGIYLTNGGYSGSAKSISQNCKLSVSAHSVISGAGGEHGGYIKRTINKAAINGTITISKNSIGNYGTGGIVKTNGNYGANGGETVFSAIQPNIKAIGGAGGINNNNDAIALINGPEHYLNKVPVVNGGNGGVIADILTAEQLKNKNNYANGGVGNNNGSITSLQNGKNAVDEIYGGGGGGGAIVFARNTSNYGKCLSVDGDKVLNNCGSSKGPSIGGTITAGKGGNGNGGAIIIRW